MGFKDSVDQPVHLPADDAPKKVPMVELSSSEPSLGELLSALDDALPSVTASQDVAGSSATSAPTVQSVGEGDLLASMRGVLAALSKEGLPPPVLHESKDKGTSLTAIT